jgi:hypothetical protein
VLEQQISAITARTPPEPQSFAVTTARCNRASWSVIEARTRERTIDLRGAFKADIDGGQSEAEEVPSCHRARPEEQRTAR